LGLSQRDFFSLYYRIYPPGLTLQNPHLSLRRGKRGQIMVRGGSVSINVRYRLL
jgi:hypothetical protein